MKIGYARVCTEQNLDLQRQALSAAGCAVIFEDKGISGAAVDRPGPADALAALESGGALVVWRLDRLVMLATAAPQIDDILWAPVAAP
jgi:DNA invertase Pin-like site-specific DNA recombinase